MGKWKGAGEKGGGKEEEGLGLGLGLEEEGGWGLKKECMSKGMGGGELWLLGEAIVNQIELSANSQQFNLIVGFEKKRDLKDGTQRLGWKWKRRNLQPKLQQFLILFSKLQKIDIR